MAGSDKESQSLQGGGEPGTAVHIVCASVNRLYTVYVIYNTWVDRSFIPAAKQYLIAQKVSRNYISALHGSNDMIDYQEQFLSVFFCNNH